MSPPLLSPSEFLAQEQGAAGYVHSLPPATVNLFRTIAEDTSVDSAVFAGGDGWGLPPSILCLLYALHRALATPDLHEVCQLAPDTELEFLLTGPVGALSLLYAVHQCPAIHRELYSSSPEALRFSGGLTVRALEELGDVGSNLLGGFGRGQDLQVFQRLRSRMRSRFDPRWRGALLWNVQGPLLSRDPRTLVLDRPSWTGREVVLGDLWLCHDAFSGTLGLHPHVVPLLHGRWFRIPKDLEGDFLQGLSQAAWTHLGIRSV